MGRGDEGLTSHQPEIVAVNGRRFAAFAAAVLVFVIDSAGEGAERILLLRSPRTPRWQIVNGGVEAGETLAAAAVREVAEEAGADLQIRLLGSCHTSSWRYDDVVTRMISTFWVAEYLGGEAVGGDDMVDSEVAWLTIDEVDALIEDPGLIPEETWVFRRALDCYRSWRGDDVELQPDY
ncbi:MAG TPA: NUDIX domain-containing protein [Acidimicrobiales bacterium]|nr:NUDIX domain-containing protein [Acidimicrobiales bacterium]